MTGTASTPTPLGNASAEAHDPRHFRDVLSQFPTGVAVIAALDEHGQPVGMAVGTFNSVSLDPPLVSFMPARSSSTFPRIAKAESFCVSVLAADQEDVCRAMAVSGVDKFDGVSWFAAPSGAPVIHGSLAWIDCTPVQTHDAGDHLIVIGRVGQLSELRNAAPLVFFRGGYGAFSASSIVAAPEADLVEQIRLVGRARHDMESLANELDLECLAIAETGDQTVCLGIADAPSPSYIPSRVGYRTPLVRPVASVFVAWDTDAARRWLADDTQDGQETGRAALERVRRRRWSIALGDPAYDRLERTVGLMLRDGTPEDEIDAVMQMLSSDRFDPDLDDDGSYDVRMLTAPVFGPTGVTLGLAVRGFRRPLTGAEVAAIARRLVAASDSLSLKVGGATPLDAARAAAAGGESSHD